MLADALSCLACPVCGAPFALESQELRCGCGHAFDVARDGHVSLLGGHGAGRTADTPEMMRARERFLAGGWYGPLAEAVADAVAARVDAAPAGGAEDVARRASRAAEPGDTSRPDCIVEVGAGTGYYLARVLAREGSRAGIAIDLSKHAARIASRAHPRIASVVADAWARLPLRDGSAAAVLDVFAPRNAAEIARVLAPGGVLVVVTPTPRHLAELVGALGLITVDPDKEARLASQLGELFEQVGAREVEHVLEMPRAAAADLVGMGPNARHVAPGEFGRRLRELPEPIVATLSATVGSYRKR